MIVRPATPNLDTPPSMMERRNRKVRTCRICGCTDANGCTPRENPTNGFSSCWWVGPDLCSFCSEEGATAPQVVASITFNVPPEEWYAGLMLDDLREADSQFRKGKSAAATVHLEIAADEADSAGLGSIAKEIRGLVAQIELTCRCPRDWHRWYAKTKRELLAANGQQPTANAGGAQ